MSFKLSHVILFVLCALGGVAIGDALGGVTPSSVPAWWAAGLAMGTACIGIGAGAWLASPLPPVMIRPVHRALGSAEVDPSHYRTRALTRTMRVPSRQGDTEVHSHPTMRDPRSPTRIGGRR